MGLWGRVLFFFLLDTRPRLALVAHCPRSLDRGRYVHEFVSGDAERDDQINWKRGFLRRGERGKGMERVKEREEKRGSGLVRKDEWGGEEICLGLFPSLRSRFSLLACVCVCVCASRGVFPFSGLPADQSQSEGREKGDEERERGRKKKSAEEHARPCLQAAELPDPAMLM